MPQTSPESLLQRLRRGPPGGVFFLHGEEVFLRDEAAERIVEVHLDPATRDFNFDPVQGSGVAAEELASLIATPPMMAEWRVVLVRDAQALSARAREAVEAAALAPPPGLVLIISATIPSGSKARFYSQLLERATSVEFAALDASDLPGWLMERARAVHERSLHPDAARALAAAGSALGVLVNELDKAVAYVGEREAITLADAQAVGVRVPRADRWRWFDSVGERSWGEALRDLPVLLDDGETGVGLVIGLAGHLLRLALVCAGGAAALERELKPYQRWLARRLAPQAKGWTLPEVEAALGELLRADRLLKSASLSDRQVVEELLLRLRLIGPGAREAA